MSEMARTEAIKILKNLKRDAEEYGKESDFVKKAVEAFDIAIASLETDEAYQLEYELTTKNDCETCIHNKGVLECDMYGCKYEPTTKNDLGVDCIDRKKLIDWINIWDITPIIKNPLIRHIQGMSSSVTPQEPRKGHWTEEFNDLEGEVRFTCSSCGKYQLFGTDFCYHCGSDNREVVEE